MNRGLQIEDLTLEQYKFFKQHIYNGVGSRDFFINPHDLIFKQAAEAHDLAYFVGGPDELRKIADRKFLSEARVSVRKHPRWKQVLFYIPVMEIYHLFLVLGGRVAWEYYDKPANTWEELIVRVRNYYTKKGADIPKIFDGAENIS